MARLGPRGHNDRGPILVLKSTFHIIMLLKVTSLYNVGKVHKKDPYREGPVLLIRVFLMYVGRA